MTVHMSWHPGKVKVVTTWGRMDRCTRNQNFELLWEELLTKVASKVYADRMICSCYADSFAMFCVHVNKMASISKQHFWKHFLEGKVRYFVQSLFIRVWQWVSIGSSNGMVPNKWEAWTNADQAAWCHMASLVHSELGNIINHHSAEHSSQGEFNKYSNLKLSWKPIYQVTVLSLI